MKKPKGPPPDFKKTFTGGFTLTSILMLLTAMIISGIMVYYGMQNDVLFPAVADPVSRNIFYLGPLIFAGITMTSVIIAMAFNLAVSITITADTLVIRQGFVSFEASWKYVIYTPPRTDKKFLRNFTLSNGKQIVRVYEMFFPRFDMVSQLLLTAKDSKRKAGWEF